MAKIKNKKAKERDIRRKKEALRARKEFRRTLLRKNFGSSYGPPQKHKTTYIYPQDTIEDIMGMELQEKNRKRLLLFQKF